MIQAEFKLQKQFAYHRVDFMASTKYQLTAALKHF